MVCPLLLTPSKTNFKFVLDMFYVMLMLYEMSTVSNFFPDKGNMTVHCSMSCDVMLCYVLFLRWGVIDAMCLMLMLCCVVLCCVMM